jgi:NAD(P)-dependent dehydrogenase (short-subunit alcohol dehydrogenase family)
MEPNVKTAQLPSHVAIATGGGRGLDRAMVLGLAQPGIHVVATAARERTEIEAVAEEVRRSRTARFDPLAGAIGACGGYRRADITASAAAISRSVASRSAGVLYA